MSHPVRLFCATLLAILLFGMLGGVTSAAEASAAFTLKPARYDPDRPATKSYFIYDAPLSNVVKDEVLVRNTGTGVGTARLYPVDMTTGGNGGAVYLADSDPRQGVGSWIQLGEREITLNPGEERTIPFTVTIPNDVTVGQHLGGIIAEEALAKPATQRGGIQVNMQTRVAAAVQVNIPGQQIENMTVSGVTASGEEGSQILLLGLHNEGTQLVKPTGMFSVSDANGREIQSRSLNLDIIIPNTTIQYPVAVQKQALGAGQYHARVDLTYGTSGVTHYEGDFSITAAQVAQVFPSSAPLAPPPVAAAAASVAPTTTNTTAPAQWLLFAGGAVIVVLALVGGIFLGRRGRSVSTAK